MQVLASRVSEKSVLGSNGEILGTVYNVTMDLESGQLDHLLVDPASSDTRGYQLSENGHLVVPAACIEAFDDYLVVDITQSTDTA